MNAFTWILLETVFRLAQSLTLNAQQHVPATTVSVVKVVR